MNRLSLMRAGRLLMLTVLLHLGDRQSAEACTVFVLNNGTTIVLAKNLDWFAGDGFIMVNPPDIEKRAFTQDTGKRFTWHSLYRSITFNQFGRELPLGGMNEHGLIIEEMNYMPSRFPVDSRPSLNEFQWVQYQLDTAAETKEVIASLEKITISPLLIHLHYMVCDGKGNTAVIEFIEGEAKVYTGDDLPIPVLVNNSYRNSLKYIALHKGFGGERTVSNGPESPERFVRAATAIQTDTVASQEPLCERAFRILETVRQDDTQWTIVYNGSTGTVYFKLRGMTHPATVALGDIERPAGCLMADLADPDIRKGTVRFRDYSFRENSRLLSTVFYKLASEAILSEGESNALCRQLSIFGGGLHQ
ncbi:linear amide C-N hydrolase [bacterium]|nr:linear amide C-N hydrolase [bacterium]